VYAIPGDITRNNSRGTNNLIKMGAKPVTESQDILIDYGILPIEKKLYLPKNDTERTIYEVLGDSPLYIDKICELTGLDAILISQSITMLELQGAIINLGNSTYIRK
jgi:DNA processing protein